jgi:LacI family transcriptional regulator
VSAAKTPTLADVADRAGVSPKTASRVLNHEGNVRPDKVARVLAAATELGFTPNEFARLLRTRGFTTTIGVVTADIGDPFWTGVIRGVELAIGDPDRDDVGHPQRFILSASTRERSDREPEIVAAMVDRRVMALLVVPTTTDQSYLGALAERGVPVVCVDRPAAGTDVDAVVADDEGGARRGVELLIAQGHRRIAFVGRPSVYTTAERIAGYRAALRAAGIVVDDRLVHSTITDAASVGPIAERLLSLDDPPTAVFTADVAASIGMLACRRTRSWRPAMVAFSDFDAAPVVEPTVTVVHNDPVELGRRAAELVLDRLAGYTGPPRRVRIETPIIERESHLAERLVPGR